MRKPGDPKGKKSREQAGASARDVCLWGRGLVGPCRVAEGGRQRVPALAALLWALPLWGGLTLLIKVIGGREKALRHLIFFPPTGQDPGAGLSTLCSVCLNHPHCTVKEVDLHEETEAHESRNVPKTVWLVGTESGLQAGSVCPA